MGALSEWREEKTRAKCEGQMIFHISLTGPENPFAYVSLKLNA